MPKYSTGGGGGDSTTCELCGAADEDLQETTVAGATLQVCGECVSHGDDDDDRSRGSQDSGGSDRSKRTARNAAKAADAASGPDPDEWVSGTSYEDDRLPYLVSDYDERVVDARQGAGLKRTDLAEEIDVDEADLLAVEQGRAAQADVGGSVIRAIEDRLDVTLERD